MWRVVIVASGYCGEWLFNCGESLCGESSLWRVVIVANHYITHNTTCIITQEFKEHFLYLVLTIWTDSECLFCKLFVFSISRTSIRKTCNRNNARAEKLMDQLFPAVGFVQFLKWQYTLFLTKQWYTFLLKMCTKNCKK